MRRALHALLTTGFILSLLMVFGAPASADHTNPNTPLAPTTGATAEGVTFGSGKWDHLANLPANPGTDLEIFRKDNGVYSSSGTLGQGAAGHVGQRMLQLVRPDGTVDPKWVADHGSSACDTSNLTGTLGLQHDVQVTPPGDPALLIDATDATGRCHDARGGGMEIVDISGLGQPGFEPREIHLTRHAGTSHNTTVDAKRPWIVYNSTSDFAGRPWIDVVNIASCLGGTTLAEKRDACRPEVHRIPFQDAWSSQRMPDGTLKQPAACHDITARGKRIYCAALNATLIFDTNGMFNEDGSVKGTPLPCTVVPGTKTGAMVTDCSAADSKTPSAEGWKFLGTVNHPGRNDGTGGTTGNTNLVVPSDEGVAVAHEADPTPDHKYMFVTDERGGGVVPGGATCTTGVDNPYGNGGVHVFDIRDPANPKYALTPEGEKAVFIPEQIVTAPTFCTSHVMELIPGENRFVMAWYSQGIKIVDYFIDANGRWTFRETASFQLPGAETWAAEHFKITDNADGTRTYSFLASDISRGIDVVSWTGAPNPTPKGNKTTDAPESDGGLLPWPSISAAFVLPVAALIGRRRRASRS